jgi:hypothetical protein
MKLLKSLKKWTTWDKIQYQDDGYDVKVETVQEEQFVK